MSTVVIKQILSTLVKLYSTSILLECRLHWRYAFTVAFGPLTNNTYLRKLKTEKEKTKLERKNQVFPDLCPNKLCVGLAFSVCDMI